MKGKIETPQQDIQQLKLYPHGRKETAKLFLSRAVSNEFLDDFESIVSPNDRKYYLYYVN